MFILGDWLVEGGNVIRFFDIFIVVEFEDFVLNLLFGIEKWYFLLKVVNI